MGHRYRPRKHHRSSVPREVTIPQGKARSGGLSHAPPPNARAQHSGQTPTVGVEELDQEKLVPLLNLKYHNSIADAVKDLGKGRGHMQRFLGLSETSV